ncbi:hypothetical protein SLEP1_g19386 [Rubroshorea leprosula]|nr:hypothetical protein SLEP1_g19386 [Rubroshorea leprosula]
MSANEIPDELWRNILEIGTKNSVLTHKDLCCLSISCRRLRRLSGENSLWSHLLSSDFPNPISQPSSSSASAKSLYKTRFERERKQKLLAHRRTVLRKQSQIAEHSRKLREIEARGREEREKLKSTVAELLNLHKVRQASVALNVWQPDIVRGRQKQIVEQCAVPVESRVHALEMEVKLCKKQIAVLDKAYRDERQRLDTANEELGSVMYHPLREYKLRSGEDNENKAKKRKLKTSMNFPANQGKTT